MTAGGYQAIKDFDGVGDEVLGLLCAVVLVVRFAPTTAHIVTEFRALGPNLLRQRPQVDFQNPRALLGHEQEHEVVVGILEFDQVVNIGHHVGHDPIG